MVFHGSTVTSATSFSGEARADRLIRFLLASLTLHAMVLAFLPRNHEPAIDAVHPPLSVRIVPSRLSVAAIPGASIPSSLPGPGNQSRGAPHAPTRGEPVAEHAATDVAPAIGIEPSRSAIDLDAALAAARAFAKETREQGRRMPAGGDAPPLPLTVEAAIAKAARPDVEVESRGANGEWVVQDRKKRCVTPIQVPHFLEGKTMLTQCELRKG